MTGSLDRGGRPSARCAHTRSSSLPDAPQGLTARELALTWGGGLLCLAVLHAALNLSGKTLALLLPALHLLHLISDERRLTIQRAGQDQDRVWAQGVDRHPQFVRVLEGEHTVARVEFTLPDVPAGQRAHLHTSGLIRLSADSAELTGVLERVTPIILALAARRAH